MHERSIPVTVADTIRRSGKDSRIFSKSVYNRAVMAPRDMVAGILFRKKVHSRLQCLADTIGKTMTCARLLNALQTVNEGCYG
jgi:hypothetical protein